MYTYKFMYVVENSGLPGFKFNVKVNKNHFWILFDDPIKLLHGCTL